MKLKMKGGNRPERDPVLEAIFVRYKAERSSLIPVLQEIQGALGYLPAPAMKAAAAYLRLPEAVVYGCATFYSQFFLTKQGKHNVKVCQGTACHVRGAGLILEAVKRKTGADAGETTEDGKFSVERVACFGSCALAPVVVVDSKVYGKMTPVRTEEIIGKIP